MTLTVRGKFPWDAGDDVALGRHCTAHKPLRGAKRRSYEACAEGSQGYLTVDFDIKVEVRN